MYYLVNTKTATAIIFNVTFTYSTTAAGAAVNFYYNDQLLAANYSLQYPATNVTTASFQYTTGKLGVLSLKSLAKKNGTFSINYISFTKIAVLTYNYNITCIPG